MGDTLIFHSLDKTLDLDLSLAVKENLLLSSSRQAEAILKKLGTVSAFALHKHPQALIAIRRIT